MEGFELETASNLVLSYSMYCLYSMCTLTPDTLFSPLLDIDWTGDVSNLIRSAVAGLQRKTETVLLVHEPLDGESPSHAGSSV